MPDAPLKAARGPFSGGYTSSVQPFFARPDQLVGEDGAAANIRSIDVVIDPFTGAVSKRAGSAIQNDTASAGAAVTGILDAHWNAKSRKLFALDSPSMDDNYPVPAILFSEDTNAGFPSVDGGFPGTVYVASSNGGGLTTPQKNYQLLSEFSSTHYPGTVSGTHNQTTDNWPYKVVPIWIDSGDGVYNRGALTGTAGTDKFMQQFVACGSRSVLQTQDELFAPNLRCTPWKWSKRLNESTTVLNETIRLYPTGPLPPLFPARIATLPTPANGSPWVEGDTFYWSVIFQDKYGGYSAPMIPRGINPVLTSGYGLMTVGSISATPTNKYPYIKYVGIPIGPEGTVARILCRTLKQNRTDATDTITVSPLDLRVIGVLKNNTQTEFLDYGGDDDSLLEDDNVIRLDLQMPRRARYMGTGDQRVIISYTLPNTAAILLALVNVNGGGNNDYDLNDTDDAIGATTPFNSNAGLVRITDTDLELHYNAGAGTSPVYDTAPTYTGTANGTAVKFPLATYTTVGALVDAINKTQYTTANCQEWAAQLAPGIDDTMPSTALTATTFTFSVTGTSSVTLTGAAADVLRVGVGMRVNGTNVTDGTYVVAKPSATTITLSTATTGAPANVFFSSYTADQVSINNSTWGYMRTFGPNLGILLHVKASSLPGYATPDKAAAYFTSSSPGANSSGTSLAPNSWLAGNRRVPVSSSRSVMKRCCTGIVDMEGTALIAYSDGIYMLRNVRGANTGEDEDYRLFTINESRGCISYLGLTSGNGWAVYPTTEGICATDKTGREFIFSGDIYSPSSGTGDLYAEILASAASAASDSDDQYFSAAVMGSKLVVSYRATGGVMLTSSYDFSPGIEASGVEELINPETKKPYLWSPPAYYGGSTQYGNNIGAMGSIRNASGRLDYLCWDAFEGATGDGRFDLINTGTADNSNTFLGIAVPAPWIASDFMSLSPQECEVKHLTTTGSASTLYFANDQTPSFNSTAGVPRALPVVAAKTRFQKQIVPIPTGQRGKTDLLWTKWEAALAASTSTRLYQIVLHYDEVESTVKYTGST